ncbi:MAG: hypothetical protein APR63_08720, partial [Desulfuromonas sp. SDB]
IGDYPQLFFSDIVIGDGDNDEQLDIYCCAKRYNDNHIYQYKWTGNNWEIYVVGYGSIDKVMLSITIGDGDNDGEFELYGLCSDGIIYQFEWNGSNWLKDTVASGLGAKIIVGDGNNDGEFELYSMHNNLIYQYKWTGNLWDIDTVGYYGGSEIIIGDGNNDGNIEIYGFHWWTIYQYVWNGNTWDRDTVAYDNKDVIAIAIGDGKSENKLKIYELNEYGWIYQYYWDGYNWNKQTVLRGSSNPFELTIGDGNNDGEFELYTNYCENLYQLKWINTYPFEITDLGRQGPPGYGVKGVYIADIDNNGLLNICAVFQGNNECNIYHYQTIPAYLSDTSYNFDIINVGDSSMWVLYLNNVLYKNLIVDSIVILLPEYSVLNYSIPDTILPGDSSAINIMFKPQNIGFYPCSVQIYCNDPVFPIISLKLTGMGDYLSSVTDIYPPAATNNDIKTVKIFGNGFNSGISAVELQKLGYTSIYATNIQVQSDNCLVCDFDLNGVFPTTYNLVVNSDTLDMCFTVNYFLGYSDYFFYHTNIELGISSEHGVSIGDGNHDDELEVYGSRTGGHIDQLFWNGTNWSITEICFIDEYSLNRTRIGDVDNDGIIEIYDYTTYSNIYQIKWNGYSWDTVFVGYCGGIHDLEQIDFGDCDYNGHLELYAITESGHLYQFKWDGIAWNKVDLGVIVDGDLNDFEIGDGDNDGQLEIYIASDNAHIYQVEWGGSSWISTDIGYGNIPMRALALGDVDNDGEIEVYGAGGNTTIYQFDWNGYSWTKTILGSFVSDHSYAMSIGDADNDGIEEIYIPAQFNYTDDYIYQFRWIDNSWIKTNFGYAYCGIGDIGDGDNDGLLEIYGGGGRNIHQLKIVPKYLSDTIHTIYSSPGDSSIWNLIVKNVNTQEIIIDSLIISLSEYSLVNNELPDTIVPGDSAEVSIMFKPDSMGYSQCSLQIFLSDSLFPTHHLSLFGICDSICPTPVYLIYPENGGYSNNTVNFIWHPSLDTVSLLWYRLQYALDSNFTISMYEYHITDDTTLFLEDLPESLYYWRVKMRDSLGIESPWSEVWSFTVDYTGVEEEISSIPDKFSYRLTYTERGKVSFMFSISTRSELTIKVYDLTGRLVDTPLSGTLSPGIHQIPFRSERSGIYFYRLESDYITETGKFMVVR